MLVDRMMLGVVVVQVGVKGRVIAAGMVVMVAYFLLLAWVANSINHPINSFALGQVLVRGQVWEQREHIVVAAVAVVIFSIIPINSIIVSTNITITIKTSCTCCSANCLSNSRCFSKPGKNSA
jgi:hypothetical protein